MAERPILVKANHSYTPVNNDELKLEQGEILTVTRKEDGGWWEGTLSNGKTGWFPSNYVEDVGTALSSSVSLSSLGNGSNYSGKLSTVQGGFGSQNSMGDGDPASFVAQQAEYRQIAFQELFTSETTHVEEMQTFWNYMVSLQKSDIVTPGDFKIITGNFTKVVDFHLNCIINFLKQEQSKPAKDQGIGSFFLENATKFEELHKMYCSNHPRAVQVVEKYKEPLSSFFESVGVRQPGILFIITSLSQPFRRLEKYPILLQEIERHVEEFHKDRGDLQRSIEYYKDIQKVCSALRKQKEMELEVISGAIKDWEGSDITQLGDIIFMNMVHLGYERVPRYFVLFSNTLLILSYNTESNSLVYEGKVPVTGITLRPLVDKETLTNAFEIAGPMIDQITVNCSSKHLREIWLDHLNTILKSTRFHSFNGSGVLQQSFGQLTPPVQAWNISRLRPAPSFNPFLAEYLTNLKKQKQCQRSGVASTTSLNLSPSQQNLKNVSRSSSTNGTNGGFSSTVGLNYNFTPSVTNEDDFAVLTLVDSFCTKNRHTVTSMTSSLVNSPSSGAPQHQEAKTPISSQIPRTLAQLVLSLQEEVSTLKQSMEEEQQKRQALQTIVQKSLKSSISSPGMFDIDSPSNSGPTSLPTSSTFGYSD